jgi:ParB family chromosome partitioning protein
MNSESHITTLPAQPPEAGVGASLTPAGVSRVTAGEGRSVDLPLASIRPSKHQPRRVFDPDALQELATSIIEHGRVLQPILVRRPTSGTLMPAAFELVAGEDVGGHRRWPVCGASARSSMASITSPAPQMALAENMARADLNRVEEARGCAARHLWPEHR